MDTENGVLEWCTEWSDGVLECWPSLMLNNAGPEAGIPMGQSRMNRICTDSEKTLNRKPRERRAKSSRGSKNGGLELGSNGGLKPQTHITTTGRQAGKKVEKGVFESGWRRVLAENGCAQLHAFTRIYTHLHNVSGGNFMSDKTQKKWARIAGLGMMKSQFWIQGAAFCRLPPPFRMGGQMAKWEIGGKDRLAGAYFRFGKWGNKLLN